MGIEDYQIDKAHAKVFARAIYRDIAAYIEYHQEEYEEFLKQEKGGNSDEDKSTY